MTKVLANIQRHLALTSGPVEDLENAIRAAVNRDTKEMQTCIGRVASGEKEADSLRRNVLDEISTGSAREADVTESE